MLDNLTSGFNIADNPTIDLQYNEMMGFTQEEVNVLMCETGVDPADSQLLHSHAVLGIS